MFTRLGRHATALVLAAFFGMGAFSARAAGVFEDVVAEAGFFYAPQRNAVTARLTATDAPLVRASVVVMGARFALSPRVLFEIEQPFVTASSDADGLATGFGDLRLRLRASLAHVPGRNLSLVLGVGTGSGTTDVFPYASQALELGAALAWSDTLAAMEYWAAAGGVLVRRAAGGLPPERRHAGFARVSAGIAVPIGRAALRLGGTYLSFEGGFGREVYFAEAAWDALERFRFALAGSLEGGKDAVRVTDAALTLRMTVSF